MDERKSKTLFVRNIPFSTTNDNLESVFSDIGPIKQCFVVKNKGDEICKGYGYVSFSLLEDAEKAKNKVKSLDGRKLYITYANKKKDTKIKKSLSRSQIVENDTAEEGIKTVVKKEANATVKQEKDITDKQETDTTVLQETDSKITLKKEKEEQIRDKREDLKKEDLKYLKAKTLVVTGFAEEDDVQTTLDKLNIKNVSKIEFPVQGRDELTAFIRFKSIRDLKNGQKKIVNKGLNGIQLSKEGRIQKWSKKPKLIVRNLSFHCSEPHLKEVFNQFGDVKEVKIPKQPNGRMFGFGFVEFTTTSAAERALQKMNSKMIRGRPVAVDWAVPKDKFENEKNDADEDSNMSGQDESDENSSVNNEEETNSESSDESNESASDSDKDSSEEEEEEGVEEDDDEEVDSDGDNSSVEDSTDEGFDESSHIRPRTHVDTNVEDGRTLFIRNLSYETEEETLAEFMSEFGKINYCRIVIDPKTEHSKGSGFVQFRTAEAAAACLQKADDQGGGLTVDGRKLLLTKAVSRQKATDLKKKEKTKEDKRNVHLVREGLIRAGTKDAEGLSKQDLAMRAKIEGVKRQRLKNPNIFVSTTRLCVHNLPKALDEKELKKIFLKAGGKQGIITECRIMRDTARVNTKGVAKSRGYAFVNFTDHQNAIEALKFTNNNPDLFKDKRRLIVEFSLENKNALLAKEKRLARFQARQKHLKQEKPGEAIEKPNLSENTDSKKDGKKLNKVKQKEKITDRYIGNVKLPEGKSIKNVLPTHWGPKVRHKPRPQTQQKSQGNGPTKRKQESDKTQSKQKRRKKSEKVDNFDRLVNSYKQKILTSENKSKWFDS